MNEILLDLMIDFAHLLICVVNFILVANFQVKPKLERFVSVSFVTVERVGTAHGSSFTFRAIL